MTQGTQSLGASEQEVQFHYDLGNAFYGLWLDTDMVYSAAMWESGDTLEEAQIRKLDYHLHQAGAQGAARVLDIGCGWGSMLRRLRAAGCQKAVGLTLSDEQVRAIVTRRDPGILVRKESWEQHSFKTPYDAIISIGAFEHFVGTRARRDEKIVAYRRFFDFCARALKPGGRLSLQTIAYGNMPGQQLHEFITSRIFPGSDLPRLDEIVAALDSRLELLVLRNDRLDYEKTCREWYRRLRQNKAKAVKMIGAEDFHRYEVYLRMSADGFRRGALDLLRLTLQKRFPRPQRGRRQTG